MNDYIILVDENDNEVGYAEKMDVHINRLRHRAFSIFIFDWNTKKMLLQKRSYGKYHSGGLWSNACCSHPHKGETMERCLNERLKEELGLSTSFFIKDPANCERLIHGEDIIYSCGKISYFAFYGEVCENEVDHIFLYSPIFDGIDRNAITINRQEIEEIKWVSIEELKLWMEKEPDAFTAWFRPAFELAYNVLCRQARNMDIKVPIYPF
jgi:isopentenyl-diphosphate delta-isomerase type 1